MAEAFIREQDDIMLRGCYTDLGKSGMDFNREGFERMMQDVCRGSIDCIVVKDLSRFGRNHIETGNYIEKIFPLLGVRLIALADCFDSMKPDSAGDLQAEAVSVNLKNLANEMYAKDIAQKVKSAKRARWEQGSYTGGIAAYGYRAEWMDGKKCLFPEEETAWIVKKIYGLFLSGQNMKEIKTWLYGRNIRRPKDYRRCGQVYWEESGAQEWSSGTIKSILTNPVYTGCLVQGLACGRNREGRRRHALDDGDWDVREHTHEALISMEMFLAAAVRFEENAKYSNKKGFSRTVPLEPDLFDGLLYCGQCGARMHRKYYVRQFSSGDRIRQYSYECPGSGRTDACQCPKKRISARVLEKLAREAVRQAACFGTMHPAACLEKEILGGAQNQAYAAQLQEIDRRMSQIRMKGSRQYQKYRSGRISREKFLKEKEQNDSRTAALEAEKAKAILSREHAAGRAAANSRQVCSLLSGGTDWELSEGLLQALIHRIEIFPDNRVKITFHFRQPF